MEGGEGGAEAERIVSLRLVDGDPARLYAVCRRGATYTTRCLGLGSAGELIGHARELSRAQDLVPDRAHFAWTAP